MRFLGSIFLSSCFIGIALGVPVLEPQKKRQPGSFRVERVPNPHYEPNGLAEIKRAYAKYGFSMPEGFDHELARRAGGGNVKGNVSATPVGNDKEFVSPVTIGGQEFLLTFDTGSSDLWVFSTQLPADQAVGHTLFDPTKSSTFKPSNQKFNVSYGDGSSAAGVVGTDTVDIGGAVVQSQAVELATNVSDSFTKDIATQGLVGLAFSKLNKVRPTPQKTFFDNVLSSLQQPVFTADLKKGTPGVYEFGNIDTSAFIGNLTFTDVDDGRGFWGFNPNKFTINGQDIDLTGIGAIADTGTTLMLLDPNSVEAYYSTVKGAAFNQKSQAFLFPCGATLPDLNVEIEGTTFTVPGSIINFAPLSKTTCLGGIQAVPKPPMIFGDVFFKAVFVVFDASTPPRLGFGKQDINVQGRPSQAPGAVPPSPGVTAGPNTTVPKATATKTFKTRKTSTVVITVTAPDGATPSPSPEIPTVFVTVTVPAVPSD